jgi:arabinose-5-phosphate isomerase
MAEKAKQIVDQSDVLETARRVISVEIAALSDLSARLDEEFERAVDIIMSCQGRVVITGMGKSGLICRKMAATFASTGTASFFLHAAEATHGDLGMLSRGDICIAISNSGTTRELLAVLPAVKRLQLPLIAITGGTDSQLATDADAVLDISVSEEACPLGLAPTASTTATLAMGDALAVAVLEKRGFSSDDFALLHPGGALGQQLVRVGELMHHDAELPTVPTSAGADQILTAISGGRLGVAGVIDDSETLVGVITDGDIRRGLQRHGSLESKNAGELMTLQPKTVAASELAAGALALMEEHTVTALFIVDDTTGKPVGIVHLHDLLRAQVA